MNFYTIRIQLKIAFISTVYVIIQTHKDIMEYPHKYIYNIRHGSLFILVVKPSNFNPTSCSCLPKKKDSNIIPKYFITNNNLG